MIFEGIRTSIAKIPYIFIIFRGSGLPAPPPLWIRAWIIPISKEAKSCRIIKICYVPKIDAVPFLKKINYLHAQCLDWNYSGHLFLIKLSKTPGTNVRFCVISENRLWQTDGRIQRGSRVSVPLINHKSLYVSLERMDSGTVTPRKAIEPIA